MTDTDVDIGKGLEGCAGYTLCMCVYVCGFLWLRILHKVFILTWKNSF